MADKTGNDTKSADTKSDKGARMKSAYELALERMERQGIERPREETLVEGFREKAAEIRRQAEAKLAELEILHGNSLKGIYDPAEREKAEQDYVRDRRRIEDERERKIAKLRSA